MQMSMPTSGTTYHDPPVIKAHIITTRRLLSWLHRTSKGVNGSASPSSPLSRDKRHFQLPLATSALTSRFEIAATIEKENGQSVDAAHEQLVHNHGH
jgi:hypothetical protein